MARGLSTRSRFLIAYLVLGGRGRHRDRRLHRAARAPGAEAAAGLVELEASGRQHGGPDAADRDARGQRLPARERRPDEPDRHRRPRPGAQHGARDRDPEDAPGEDPERLRARRPERERHVRALWPTQELQAPGQGERGRAARSSGGRRSSWRSTRSSTPISIDNVVVFVPPGAAGRRSSRTLRSSSGARILSPETRTTPRQIDAPPEAKPPLPARSTGRSRLTVDNLTKKNGSTCYPSASRTRTNFGQVVVLQPA